MLKIRKGDTVQIISGNEVGVRGEVDKVLRVSLVNGKKQRVGQNFDATKVVVKGVNLRKKHQRRTGQTRTQTGIIEFEAPIHISNVMLVCPSCDAASRIGIKVENSKRVRFCKRCESIIDKV